MTPCCSTQSTHRPTRTPCMHAHSPLCIDKLPSWSVTCWCCCCCCWQVGFSLSSMPAMLCSAPFVLSIPFPAVPAACTAPGCCTTCCHHTGHTEYLFVTKCLCKLRQVVALVGLPGCPRALSGGSDCMKALVQYTCQGEGCYVHQFGQGRVSSQCTAQTLHSCCCKVRGWGRKPMHAAWLTQQQEQIYSAPWTRYTILATALM